MKKILDKTIQWFGYACMLALAVFFFVSSINDGGKTIQANIEKISEEKANVITQFGNAAIVPNYQIEISKPSEALQFMAPRNLLDPLYGLLFLSFSILVILFFRDFNYKNPFTKKALLGFRIALFLAFGFVIADFLRTNWFDEQVKLLTQNQYTYRLTNVFASPLYWLPIVLLRVVWVFKKGVEMKNEADLTV